LRAGIVPKGAEDKWFIYFVEPSLFVHRSGTGKGAYRVDLTASGEGCSVEAAFCAADFLNESEPAYQSELLAYIVGRTLLARDMAFPSASPRPIPQLRPTLSGWRKGRINRAQYWASLSVVAAIYAALMVLPHPGHISVSEIVLIIVCVPRLHDLGLTGWIAAIPFGVEIVCAITTFSVMPVEAATEAMGFVVIAIAGLLVLLGALPGQKANNRFGPQPRPGIGFGRRVDRSAQTASYFD
jgi:uncharacterized membrane protein YhaH (DUF805 family)